jgi:hypothetical protein
MIAIDLPEEVFFDSLKPEQATTAARSLWQSPTGSESSLISVANHHWQQV